MGAGEYLDKGTLKIKSAKFVMCEPEEYKWLANLLDRSGYFDVVNLITIINIDNEDIFNRLYKMGFEIEKRDFPFKATL